MTVYSLEEAEEWFLNNPSGGITCADGDLEVFCKTYQEAKKWYKSDYYFDFQLK